MRPPSPKQMHLAMGPSLSGAPMRPGASGAALRPGCSGTAIRPGSANATARSGLAGSVSGPGFDQATSHHGVAGVATDHAAAGGGIRSGPSGAVAGVVDLTGGRSVEAPLCHCSQRAVCRSVHTPGPNLGKEFFTCSCPQNSIGKRCEFFVWATDTQAADRSLFLGGAKRRAPGAAAGTAGADRGGASPWSSGAGAPDAKRLCKFVSALSLQLASVQSLFTTLSPAVPSDLIGEFKALPGAQAFPAEQLGSQRLELPLTSLPRFASLATQRGLRIETPPQWLLGGLSDWNQAEAMHEQKGETTPTGSRLSQLLPEFLNKTLMPFQRIGIEFALSRRGRVLIGDEMGLGKTVQALAIAHVYKADWPLLVVCPSSLRLNWREELIKWLGSDVPLSDIRVIMKGTDADLGDGDMSRVTIASYELVSKLPAWQLSQVGVTVCDESHYLKNRMAKRTKFVCGQLLSNTKRVLLLTGTPAMSRPSDLYSQLSVLAPKLFGSWTNFTERYCAAHKTAYGWDTSGSSNLSELHTLLCDTVLIRRLKKDVLTQLLPKQRSLIYIETTPAQMKQVQLAMAAQTRAAQALRAATSREAAAGLELAVKSATTKLEAATCEAKIGGVCGYIRELLDASPGLKFLLFAHHQAMLNKLEAFLREKLKISLIRIDGGTPQRHRLDLTERFQTDKSCQVALLGITAAGVGLTLTAAHTVVFAEQWWTPGSLIQAEDRVHRIGQKNSVDVRYLLAKNTVDDQMWSIVGRKLNVVGRSLDGAAAKMNAKSHVDNDELIVNCRGVTDDEASGSSADEADEEPAAYDNGGGWTATAPPPRRRPAAVLAVPHRTRKGNMTIERGFDNAAARRSGAGAATAAAATASRDKSPRGRRSRPATAAVAGAGADSDGGTVAAIDVDDDDASEAGMAGQPPLPRGHPRPDTCGDVVAADVFPEEVLLQLEGAPSPRPLPRPLPSQRRPLAATPPPRRPRAIGGLAGWQDASGGAAPAGRRSGPPLPPPLPLLRAPGGSGSGGGGGSGASAGAPAADHGEPQTRAPPPPRLLLTGAPPVAPPSRTLNADEALALRLRARQEAIADAMAAFGDEDAGVLLFD